MQSLAFDYLTAMYLLFIFRTISDFYLISYQAPYFNLISRYIFFIHKSLGVRTLADTTEETATSLVADRRFALVDPLYGLL